MTIECRYWLCLAAGLLLAAPSLGQEVLCQSETRLSSREAGKAETTAGNLICDAFMAVTGADLAFENASALETGTLNPGPIRDTDVRRAFVYPEDKVVLLKLSGKQLREALERSVFAYPGPNSGFLQIGGFSFTFDASKPPGERVKEIRIKGGSFSESSSYRVSTNYALAKGGLGYFKVFGESDIVTQTSMTSAEAVAKYLRDKKTIAVRLEDRIVAQR